MMRRLPILHRWLGLALAIPVVVQGLTGAILALEPVLPSGPAGSASAEVSINRIIAVARAAAPDGMRPARYVPPHMGTPATVILGPKSGPARSAGLAMRVDPATFAVISTEPANTGLLGCLRRLHTSLLLEAWGGRQIIGWIGIGLLILAAMGVVLWWPRPGAWRAAFTIDRSARGWRLQRRLHGAAGGWAALMLLASAASGAALAFPQTTRAALGIASGAASGPHVAPPRDPRSSPDWDQAVAAAHAAHPGTELRGVLFSAKPTEPARVLLGPTGEPGAISLLTVAVDPWEGRVLQSQGPDTQSSGERVLRWMHDLHQGMGLGPLWRGLTIAAGLALSALAVTGTAMWLHRHRNLRRTGRARRATLAPGPATRLPARESS